MRRAARELLAVAALGALLAAPARAGVQRIEPSPAIGEMGSETVVTVITDRGTPLPGVVVRARPSGGKDVELGSTDQQGAVRFRPPAPGRYEFRAWLPQREVMLLALYEVLPQRRTWVWALICVPAGLVLLWLNLRRWRRGG